MSGFPPRYYDCCLFLITGQKTSKLMNDGVERSERGELQLEEVAGADNNGITGLVTSIFGTNDLRA